MTDFRLKILRFIRKNKMAIFLLVSLLIIIYIVNQYLKNYGGSNIPETTYEPHVSVMNSSDSVSKGTANEIENMIETYVKYCNEGEFASAFNMLSDTCKDMAFNNDLGNFMSYVETKIPTPKKYSIQDYLNKGNTYVYQIKYMDDLLSTGLTNSTYNFTEEKIIFKKVRGNLEMSVGNFIDYADIKNIFENEYVKIDVQACYKFYSMEKYRIKILNRSNYTLVISDGQVDNEVIIKLSSGENRKYGSLGSGIVLEPHKSKELTLDFPKYYDNNDDSMYMIFNSIRVMENYSGVDEIPEDVRKLEILNAVDKFSVTIPVSIK